MQFKLSLAVNESLNTQKILTLEQPTHFSGKFDP